MVKSENPSKVSLSVVFLGDSNTSLGNFNIPHAVRDNNARAQMKKKPTP